MIRIRGLVGIAQKARNQLKAGIPASEVEKFKQFVTQSVGTVERLCAEARVTPDQLPPPSRKAYHFLKRLDLDNLPVNESHAASQSVKTIGLKNVIRHQQALLQAISNLARGPTPDEARRNEISQTLEQSVAGIERLCARHDATPANLTGPSRQAYAWMKFLTNESTLQLHLHATRRAMEIAERVLRVRAKGPGRAVVQFTNLAGLYKSRSYRNAIVIQVSEGFIMASDDILEAVITSALLGRSQKTAQVIRDYSVSEEFSDVLIELDLMVEPIAERAKGKCYDLDEIFEAVNREYLGGQMAKPHLTWSRRFTVRKFAHYERARDRVVMSLTLDDDHIPRFVVEFVLYHELLHKQHGARWINDRLTAHTPEFRQDEQKFKLYEEAQQWMKKLASSS